MNKNNNQIKAQEINASNYTEQLIKEKQANSFGVQSFWQEAVLNFLKNQALVFCGQAITHLRKQTILWAVDLSYWLLTNLEDYLVKCYEKANKEEKVLFLTKIKENFPASQLLKKLEK